MSEVITYTVRGKAADGRMYKIVNRQVKRMAEARGEDTFVSRFEAIFNAAQALKAWRYAPDGICFDVHEKRVRKPAT